jgi:fibronectin type 3 domain-containing protein
VKYISRIHAFMRLDSIATVWSLVVLAGGLLFLSPAALAQAGGACDLNNDGTVNSLDVDLAVNMSLGVTACTANIQASGVCNAVTVQRVVNKAVGGATAVCVTGYPHSVTLTWGASPSSGVAGYRVYRGTATGGPYTAVNSALVSALSYADTQVQGGLTYFYVVRAVDATGTESANSNEATAPIPTP